MSGLSRVTRSQIAQRLRDYAGEFVFAARAPASLRQSLRLIGITVDFHARNWRGATVDKGPRLALDLSHDGYPMSVNLRPHDGDLSILYEIFARRSYLLPAEILAPAKVKTIFDFGANIGLASLYFAARYPHAIIYSVEPNPDNFALLMANTASEPRIRPIQACITPVPQAEVFIATAGKGSHYQMTTAARGVGVRGMSIEELCAEHAVAHIDLLKIDVEGAEEQIFADGSFLPRAGVIVAELHGAYDLGRFNADLARWGFKARLSEFSPDPNIALALRQSPATP